MEPTETATAPDIDHSECIDEAAAKIFTAACGVTIAPVSTAKNLTDDGMIFAVISLSGDVEWSLFLALPKQTAVAVAAKFAGFEIPFESDDMGDAVGELTNILAGEIKARLDKKEIKVELSLPSVIRAKGLEVLMQRDAVATKTCFDSPLGNFWAGVTVGKGNDSAACGLKNSNSLRETA